MEVSDADQEPSSFHEVFANRLLNCDIYSDVSVIHSKLISCQMDYCRDVVAMTQ